ncbi:hypothetical protein Q8A67_019788 [Cirrhinus molitorella]|uniref:Uncharacterized protein n=1 Tax=Cirrhinus molitorella TaxID=172907 RepID=A0AA88TIA2_9TELE|nr:hypothetical protein Q8A67_019788 [Cirrhinus molitorella]
MESSLVLPPDEALLLCNIVSTRLWDGHIASAQRHRDRICNYILIWFRLLAGLDFVTSQTELSPWRYGPPLMACRHLDPLRRSSKEVLKM